MSTELPIHLPSQPRILVIRADRLGDVILSIPVFEVLKRTYPRSHLTVWVQSRVAPILSGLPFIDEVVEVDVDSMSLPALGVLAQQGKWDLALVLQPRWKLLVALWFARIPHRLGPLSKFYSFLLLTGGMRQRRSQVDMHEADYNLQLLRLLGVEVGSRTVLPKVVVPEEARREVQEAGARMERSGASQWVAIHPGMGGSALNWPEEHYLELAEALLKQGLGVVVTGGPTEQDLIERFATRFSGKFGERFRTFGGSQAPTVDRLAAVFENVSVIVAPSTGPLHLAAALGKRVVTFFPPIRVQSARRWGPYFTDLPGEELESKASVMVPQVHCGQDFKCRGIACRFYPCMSTLSVTQALGLVQNHLVKVAQEKL